MAKRRTTGFAGRKRDVSSGKKGGRPVVHDPIKMAEQLLEWVEKDESINICGFCADNGYRATLIREKCKSSDEFKDAFEKARLRLAERRERYLNIDMLHTSSFGKYQSYYDPFLDRYEDKKKDQDARRKKEIAEASSGPELTLSDILTKISLGEYSQE